MLPRASLAGVSPGCAAVTGATCELRPTRLKSGISLAVKLQVEDRSLPQAELATLAKEAHEKICPYSHATRHNVDVQLTVSGR